MKHLFLLGGHGAIGSAIKTEFEENGYTVTAPSSKELDLSDPAALTSYMKGLTQPVDAVVFCAGHNDPAQIGQLTPEEIQKTLQINTISLSILKTSPCRLCCSYSQSQSHWGRRFSISTRSTPGIPLNTVGTMPIS